MNARGQKSTLPFLKIETFQDTLKFESLDELIVTRGSFNLNSIDGDTVTVQANSQPAQPNLPRYAWNVAAFALRQFYTLNKLTLKSFLMLILA